MEQKNYKYLLLPNPGHNRVYFEAAKEISIREMKCVLNNTHIITESICGEVTANIRYISFEACEPLNTEELHRIESLSSFYALFQKCSGEMLLPIDCGEDHAFPDSLNTILKYPGKTNEQFTRLMVNIALSFCKSKSESNGKPHLFDPMAGKGTTLFEGIIQGFNVTGMEILPKFAEECNNYFIKFLETGRYKHKSSKESRGDSNGRKLASLFQVEFAGTKEAFTGGNTQKFRFFSGDTLLANQFIKKQSVDIVVTDLPYGVQHGSVEKKGSKSRNAAMLAESLFPVLYITMKKGASLVMAFNEFTTKKEQLMLLLSKNGFDVINNSDTDSFSHRVDQAIMRDLVIAIKP